MIFLVPFLNLDLESAIKSDDDNLLLLLSLVAPTVKDTYAPAWHSSPSRAHLADLQGWKWIVSPKEPFPKLQSHSLPTACSTNPHYEESYRSLGFPDTTNALHHNLRSSVDHEQHGPCMNKDEQQSTLEKTNQSQVLASCEYLWVYQTHRSAQFLYALQRSLLKNNIPTHVLNLTLPLDSD